MFRIQGLGSRMQPLSLSPSAYGLGRYGSGALPGQDSSGLAKSHQSPPILALLMACHKGLSLKFINVYSGTPITHSTCPCLSSPIWGTIVEDKTQLQHALL